MEPSGSAHTAPASWAVEPSTFTAATGAVPTAAAQQHHSSMEPRSVHATPTKAECRDSPFLPSPGGRIAYSDRLIPSRAVAARLDFSVLDREMVTSEATRITAEREDRNPVYDHLLRSELLGAPPCPVPPSPDKSRSRQETARVPCSPGKSLFRFKSGDAQSPLGGAAPQSPFARSPLGDEGVSSPFASPKVAPRKIPRAPFKVLDAPALQDDFYLNLVDWSAQNVLAVGLGNCVYLWSAHNSKVSKLCELSASDSVSSVSWSQRGSYLSVGTHHGKVQIWDVAHSKTLRVLEGHKGRVGTMAWSSHLLASGSRDRSVLLRDVRAKEAAVGKLAAHRSEVCGLKWSPDNQHLASGGNDNNLFVWTPTQSASPVHKFSDHIAAVKAIAWSPHQHGLLASGGGTADRCIRFWNTVNGTALNCIDTGSQVCNLVWSKNVNEIVSTHGYSQNQVVVWKYPSLTKLATLTGHSLRVLYLAASPDGQSIVTGAGDETLRFWSVFPGAKTQASDIPVSSLARTTIR